MKSGEPIRGIPHVTLRRLWHSAAYGLWIGAEFNRRITWAKPAELIFNENEHQELSALPDPTFVIPLIVAKRVFEEFVQALELEGESATQSKQVLDAKNEALKDARNVIDRLFNLLDKPH